MDASERWAVSGKRVTFVGDAMAAVVQGVEEVRILIGELPVVVGGLAVMCRLASPYRATTDLDVLTGCSVRHRSSRRRKSWRL